MDEISDNSMLFTKSTPETGPPEIPSNNLNTIPVGKKYKIFSIWLYCKILITDKIYKIIKNVNVYKHAKYNNASILSTRFD